VGTALTKPHRILFLASSSQIGGGNVSLLTLAKQLASEGREVRIVCPAEGPMLTACKESGLQITVKCFRQPECKRMDLVILQAISWRRLLVHHKVDVVHANDLLVARSIAIAAWMCGVPVVCHVRFGRLSFETLKWLFRGVPHPRAFIFNSGFLQREIGPSLLKTCPKSIQSVIHNAVDLRRFSVKDSGPCHRPRVGIVGNLIPLKGHVDFLQMAFELTNRNVDAEYWIVGEDIHNSGYKKVLDDKTKELGLADRIRFLGHRGDIPEILNELDVAICSSHYEPFGRCVIEAMACGKPVVATNVGGIPEIIEDQISGILVPPHAPSKMADAVASLASDPSLRAKLASSARRRVERLFGVETHVRQVSNVYNTIFSNGSEPVLAN
jgi:glycosyltransferase involved in cell wall biosynthesis